MASDSLVCLGSKRKPKRCVSDVVGVRRKCLTSVKVRQDGHEGFVCVLVVGVGEGWIPRAAGLRKTGVERFVLAAKGLDGCGKCRSAAHTW